MLNLLVAVDHSLEASFALRTACLLGMKAHIQPIYVIDPPGRNMSLGAGWARKSWERELRQHAEDRLEDLLTVERIQCAVIDEPLIMTGDPIQAITGHFWKSGYDMMVVGSPYREMRLLNLSRRISFAASKSRREMPVLVVCHPKNIQNVVVLIDGGIPAEKSLRLLVRLRSFRSFTIGLVSISNTPLPTEAQHLVLERGLNILKEKGIDASGYIAASLSAGDLADKLKTADLVVSPFSEKNHNSHLRVLSEHEIRAVLLYICPE